MNIGAGLSGLWRAIVRWMDAWLPRLSHLSQIGLLALAAIGLFYTVIPLFKKAILDKQIAEKTVQLRTYTVSQLVTNAGVVCTGLMTSPSMNDRSGRSGCGDELDIPVGACVKQNVIANKRLSELSMLNQTLFLSQIERAASDLERFRMEALAQCKALPRAGSALNKLPLPPADSVSGRIVELERIKGVSDSELDKYRLSEAQRDIARRYGDLVRERLIELNSMSWPESASGQ